MYFPVVLFNHVHNYKYQHLYINKQVQTFEGTKYRS
jgi:hypothetical protein